MSLALDCYRVLDLTDIKGYYCGKILGDLGADVIKVEPVGGDPLRHRGPFYNDEPDPEKNLYWWACNNNKRGITLNLETRDGQKILKELVKKADVVVESYKPGYLAGLGLGYDDLKQVNPQIIFTSITPFGQEGPYRDFKASDITISAMGGLMNILGDPDRPPVRVSLPQSYFWGGGFGAFGALTALYYRGIVGEGQQVDVSMQACMIATQAHAPLFADIEGVDTKRSGKYVTGRSKHGAIHPGVHRCLDGYISWAIYGGPTGAKTNKIMTAWMESAGKADPFLSSKDWDSFVMAEATQEDLDNIVKPVSAFLAGMTKKEFMQEAVKRGMMGCMVSTVKDILEDPQLEARDYWTELEHPELGVKVKYPGPFSKFSETPPQLFRRAPLIGEHNKEIYLEELGYSKDKLQQLRKFNVI